MNILDIQDKLKNFSQEQLIQEMQMPTGQLPQFLLLSEITRRKKMQDSYAQQQDQAQEQTTVAQDAINAAGMPQDAAQQLAGTMAPQTDMAGNTGAMPQQQMMPQAPQPVQGMAGGGIVALRDGGPVQGRPGEIVVRDGRRFVVQPDGSPSSGAIGSIGTRAMPTPPQMPALRTVDPPDVQRPLRLVVVGGQQFIEMPDGSLTPPGMLGLTESDMAGAGTADLAQPPPMDRSFGVNPSYREDRAEVSPTPAEPVALPQAGLALPQTVGRPSDDPQALADDLFNVIGGVIRPPLEALDQSPVGQYRVHVRPGQTPDPTVDPMLAFQEDFGAAGQGFPADSISGAPATAPTVDPLAPYDGLTRGITGAPVVVLPPRVPSREDTYYRPDVPFDPLAMPEPQPAPDPISPGVEPGGLLSALSRRVWGRHEYADRLLSEGAISQAEHDALTRGTNDAARAVILRRVRGEDTPVDFAALAVDDPTAEAIASAEEAAALAVGDPTAEEAIAAAEAARDALTTAPTAAPPGPPGGGGGGIASVARGAGAPSDFEQALMTMLAAREKRAEQDKWLALAQAGMALMSSTQPTFGGALGEAGASGLGALREGQAGSEADRLALLGQIEQSRMGRERLDLERQALAARQAASGAAAPLQDPSAFGLSADEDRQLTRFSLLAESMDPATQLMGQQGVDELMQRVQARSNMGGAGSTPSVLAPSARSN